MINSTLDEPGMLMGFEAVDDALIFWLDMCGKILFEIFNSNVPKVVGNNMLNRKDGQTGDWTQDPPDIYQML